MGEKQCVHLLSVFCLPPSVYPHFQFQCPVHIDSAHQTSQAQFTIHSESCWEANEPVYEVTENSYLALSIYEFYLLFHLPGPPARGLELISLGLLPFVCSHSC